MAQMFSPWFLAALFAGRLLLVTVFAVAGVAKLRDRDATWAMLRAFGANVRASDAMARVLPWLELLVAVGLLFGASAFWAALGACALLGAFTLAIVVNLARGRRPECRCFGQLASAPIGPATIVRNLLFAALAATAFVVPPARADAATFGLLHDDGPALAAVAVALALASIVFLMLQILRQQGRILLRLDELSGAFAGEESLGRTSPVPTGLPIASEAPAFELPDLMGKATSLAALRAAGLPIALVFLHPACGPCRTLVPTLLDWNERLAEHLTLVVISEGASAENRDLFAGFPAARVLVQPDRAVADAYQAYGTPGAVLIDSHGTIGSQLAMGREAIVALVQSAGHNGRVPATRASASGLAVGANAPPFSAPTSAGSTFGLEDLRGSETALVFWNPTCGFCRQAADDMIAWERTSGVRLVVLASAPDEDLVARGLRGDIVLDEGMRIGGLFGARGTPMAVRLAADGTIASPVAAGRDAIAALLAPRPASV